MAQRFVIEGGKELERRLAALPKAMSKTVLRNALKTAAKPVLEAVRTRAPYDPTPTKGFEQSKHLRDRLYISTMLVKNQKRGRRRPKGEVEVFIGSDAPHAHLLEFGTTQRFYKTKTGKSKSTGSINATPFLRPAWDATKKQAKDILFSEILVQLSKAVARLAKRAEKGTLSKRAIKELGG